MAWAVGNGSGFRWQEWQLRSGLMRGSGFRWQERQRLRRLDERMQVPLAGASVAPHSLFFFEINHFKNKQTMLRSI